MKHFMPSVEDYELYLYTLTEKFPSVKHSPEMSFDPPNPQVTIREIESLIEKDKS